MLKAFAIFALAAAPALPSAAADRVIFGEDDRVEYYQMPAAQRRLGDSTVGLWKNTRVKLDPSGAFFQLWTSKMAAVHNLCEGQKFREQPKGPSCSGALVGEDLVLTAGHCIVTEEDCRNTAFVFGFRIEQAGGKPSFNAPLDDVYSCSAIVKRQLTSVVVSNDNQEQKIYGPDYAVIRLDRKVKGRAPLGVNRRGGLKKGEGLFMTGYPLGLPMKYAANARVVKDIPEEQAFFHTDLDSFPANSGSPVFNARTGLIEGIHVRGESETFIPTFEGCNVYVMRPQNAGYPGAATKVDFALEAIPPLPGEAEAMPVPAPEVQAAAPAPRFD